MRLKFEGYYADLQVALDTPGLFIAGRDAFIAAEITNHGPADVDDSRFVLYVDGGLVVQHPWCELRPDSRWHCEIPSVILGVGYSIRPDILVVVPPDAEGSCAIGVLATSNRFDPVPENNFAIDACWIARKVALQVQVVHQSILQGASGPEVEFAIANLGPSLAEDVRLSARIEGDVGDLPIECVVSAGQPCPAWFGLYLTLEPGALHFFRVRVPEFDAERVRWELVIRADARPGEELNPWDNTARFIRASALFRSGFEP